MRGFLTFLVERGLAAQRTALLLEEGPEHHHASETLAPLVPAPYSPRRWCLCHAAPLERRLKLWLLTKYLFSQVREPAALPQGSCPNTAETAPPAAMPLPPALNTRNESDTVANQARMTLTGSRARTGHGHVNCARNNSRSEVTVAMTGMTTRGVRPTYYLNST